MEFDAKSFPHSPGVYLMKDSQGHIIYIGKAKDLQGRVKTYFANKTDGRYQIDFLMRRVEQVDYLVTANEKEALLLENSLIKKHKPRYNIFLKDDKSYISLKLNMQNDFPRLIPTRTIQKDGSLYYGPYSSSAGTREILDFVQKFLKLRSCTDREFLNRSRPCIEYQIKRCTAPCVGYVSKEDYTQQVNPVRLLLEGKSSALEKEMMGRMDAAVTQQNYEEAAHFRDLLAALHGMLESQNVVHHGGGHADIVALYQQKKSLIALFHVRDGKLEDGSYYPLQGIGDGPHLLEEFLSRYYLTCPMLPAEILVSEDVDLKVLEAHLSEKRGGRVKIICPIRGEKKKRIDLALMNAREQYDRWVKNQIEMDEILENLKEKFYLPKMPSRMECYDISNTSGCDATASRVVFMDGLPEKSLYRHYRIQYVEGPNDYAMMQEVLQRRFSGDKDLPDMILVDGGKGHLQIAIQVLKELNLQISVVAIAKGVGPGARAKGEWKGKKEEEIFLPNQKNPIIFKTGSPELKLLQRIRDEAHRFALAYHQKLRDEKRIP